MIPIQDLAVSGKSIDLEMKRFGFVLTLILNSYELAVSLKSKGIMHTNFLTCRFRHYLPNRDGYGFCGV